MRSVLRRILIGPRTTSSTSDPYDMIDFDEELFSKSKVSMRMVPFHPKLVKMIYPRTFPDYYLKERCFVQSVANLGYERIRTFPEAHGGFFGVWKYLHAFQKTWKHGPCGSVTKPKWTYTQRK